MTEYAKDHLEATIKLLNGPGLTEEQLRTKLILMFNEGRLEGQKDVLLNRGPE